MANSLGALVVSLGLDAAEFTRGLTKAEFESQKAMRRIKDEAEVMGKVFAVAALAAGAAAIKMGSDFINAAADLDDLAEKTGASVEGLSKLAQQARISGADFGTIEMGLIKLGKALNENDEEAKKATKALDALGLKAADLKGLDTAEALKIVAAEMNKYGDSSGKTALALDLFGKSGAQLLPILKDMANDGELNATVTAKQAAEAEELGKSWRRLTNDARNIGQAVALDLVPWFQKMIEQFTEGTRVAGGFWNSIRLFGFSTITTGNAPEKIREIGDEITDLQAKRQKFIDQGREGWTKTIDTQIDDLKKQQEYARILTRQIAPGRGWDEDASIVARPLNYRSSTKAAAEGKSAKKVIDEDLKDRQAQIALSGRMMAADLRAFEDYKKEIKRIADEVTERQYYENIFGADAVGISTEDLKTKLKATIDGADALGDAWDRAGLAAGGFDENGKAIVERLKETDDIAKSLGLTFSSSFEELVFGAREGVDALKLVEAAALDVAKIFFRKSVTEPIANAIGSLDFGTLLKGFFGGASSGGVATPGFDASGVYVGSYATGSDYVPRTGLAMVHQGERIIPAGQNNGGVYAPITINAPGADPFQLAQVAAEVRALRADLRSGASTSNIQRRGRRLG